MARQIIKQPDGRYAIFSSVVDDFILLNATPQDIIDDYVVDCRTLIADKVAEVVAALDRGEKPYYDLTKTFDEAVRIVRSEHPLSETLKILRTNGLA